MSSYIWQLTPTPASRSQIYQENLNSNKFTILVCFWFSYFLLLGIIIFIYFFSNRIRNNHSTVDQYHWFFIIFFLSSFTFLLFLQESSFFNIEYCQKLINDLVKQCWQFIFFLIKEYKLFNVDVPSNKTWIWNLDKGFFIISF